MVDFCGQCRYRYQSHGSCGVVYTRLEPEIPQSFSSTPEEADFRRWPTFLRARGALEISGGPTWYSTCPAFLCDLFGMVKWPFLIFKWPPTRGWKGHFESPGACFFLDEQINCCYILYSQLVTRLQQQLSPHQEQQPQTLLFVCMNQSAYVFRFVCAFKHLDVFYHVLPAKKNENTRCFDRYRASFPPFPTRLTEVCYTPIPVGESFGDWLGESTSSIWLRDLDLIQQMDVNLLRVTCLVIHFFLKTNPMGDIGESWSWWYLHSFSNEKMRTCGMGPEQLFSPILTPYQCLTSYETWKSYIIQLDTHLKFNSSPLKSYLPKRKGSSSNHHFSGANC